MKLSHVNGNKFVFYIVPVKVKLTAEKSQLTEGERINLGCSVDGYPVPRVSWYKNNQLIQASNHIIINGNIISDTMVQ